MSKTHRYPDVAVVIITRNEERAIKKVIDDCKAALPGAEIFVIDGSDDATPEIARRAGATVMREPGGGFGPALHMALMTPKQPIVVTVDADDTYPATEFPMMVEMIRQGWDVVGTNRLGARPPAAMPMLNWGANQVFSGIASLRARTRLRDVHSGQRAYRATVLRSFDWIFIGPAFPVDLLLWPAIAGMKVTEIPIHYAERIGETKLRRWSSGVATLRRLMRRRSEMTGKAMRAAAGADRPISERRYSRVRDVVLTNAATVLSRSKRLLWYADSLVLSARYMQLISLSPWARGSHRYADRIALWEKAVEPRLAGAGFAALEFGVADGLATVWWSRRGIVFTAWHGFDTFEGLPGAWARAGVPVMSAGMFTPSGGPGSVPEVTAPFPYTWHKGLIEDTLPKFVRPGAPLFVLIDVDLLEPTLVILDWLKSKGRPGDLVYFDEAFDPWNEGMAIRRAVEGGLTLRAIGHTGSSLLAELVATDSAGAGAKPLAASRRLDVDDQTVRVGEDERSVAAGA
jgi:glycosyltransferase involved in cell wall biosynthesis